MIRSKFEVMMVVTNPEGNRAVAHQHMFYELVYYVKGTGLSMIDGETYHYSPGSYAVITPNSLHSEVADTETVVSFIGFSFEGSPSLLRNVLLQDQKNKEIYQYMQRLRLEMSRRQPFYLQKLDHITSEIVIDLARRLQSAPEASDKNIEHVIKYINENCTRPVDFKVLAELSGYSYDWFRHFFRLQTGMSPQQYVISQRISKAKKLLLSGEHKISDLSQECGFSTSSHFIETFKKVTKLTPTEYRAIMNVKDELK